MLKIIYGKAPDAIYNTAVFFDNTYLDNWIEDDFSKKIIKSVDKAVPLGNKAIETKALGVIPVTKLSGGTKTLLLMYHKPDRIYNASTCGDNCAKWILKIADKLDSDLTINLHHVMDFGSGKFEIELLNNGVIVHDMAELVSYAGELLYEGEMAREEEREMPEITRFYGIIIKMFFKPKEHEPSHIHAIYGEFVGVFDLKTKKMTDGDLPLKAQELVEEWLSQYIDELQKMWDTQKIDKLPPL